MSHLDCQLPSLFPPTSTPFPLIGGPTIVTGPLPRTPDTREPQSPAAVRTPRLFPLHLAPIDEFFLMDDSPAYPMSSFIQLDFRGELEPQAFHDSLAVGLGRHPLLAALVQPAKRGEPCWVPHTGGPPAVPWNDHRAVIHPPGREYLDLTREPGVRFWVQAGGGKSRLSLQVHHACTDGTGVYRFLGDLLAAYAIRTSRSRPPVELQPLDPQLLRRRRRKMSRVALQGSRWECTRHALSEAWHIFGQAAQPLAAPGSSTRERPSTWGAEDMCFGELTAAEHQELRQVAARRGATVNDLLLAQMFRSVVQWNSAHGITAPRGRLRLMMPFDMRDQYDYAMPAANMTAYTFLDRRVGQCTHWDALLDGIHGETADIKQGHQGTDFIDALMVADQAPWLLPRLLRLNRCMATVTLSNVGDPTKRFLSALPREAGRIVSGNVVLEDIRGVPPLRQKSHSSLAVFSYLRKLTICMRCDPYRFSRPATQEFLDLYLLGLRSLFPAQQHQKTP